MCADRSSTQRSPIHSTDGQDTAEVARTLDWSGHPLGLPQSWPIELRTSLSMLFNNRHPMCLFWGDENWYFYNDGYLPIVSAAKHPWAMGRPGREVWAEAWPVLLPQIEQVRRGGGATWHENQLIPVLKDGVLTDSHFTYSYSPVFLEAGQVGGTLVTCTETTAQVRAERDLRSKMEAIEHSLNGFDIVDSQGRFIYANRAYLRMWGYESLDEILGTTPASHCADPRTPEIIIRTLKEKGECDLEFVARRKDGTTFDVRMWARLARDSEGREIYPTTSIDVTARKKSETALREAIVARDEFLSIASHELRTPLTSLKLQTQSMMRAMRLRDPGVFAPERVAKLVEQTDRQTERLVRLVDDMLDVSRIQTGKLGIMPSQVDLCELARATAEHLQPHFDAAKATLAVELCGPLLVEIDRDRMEQVLVNLLTNALRYGRREPVRVVVDQEDGLARVTVEDRGIGIAPEHQTRIFDRFERAVSAAEISGMGLGLYISRQIVESHGGKLIVESTVGVGSRFVVEIPSKRDHKLESSKLSR